MFCVHQMLEKEPEYSETVHQPFIDFKEPMIHLGACRSIVVKALHYKPEGCGFETR
jgi:hypothetical protein